MVMLYPMAGSRSSYRIHTLSFSLCECECKCIYFFGALVARINQR